MLALLPFILLAVAVIGGSVIFALMVFPGSANKKAPFVSTTSQYPLSPVAANHFASIGFDQNTRQVVIRAKSSTQSAVVTLLMRKNGSKVSFDVYHLNFANGNTASIPVTADVTEYYVVVEKVNGQAAKDTVKSGHGLIGTVIYSSVLSVLTVGGVIAHTYRCSEFLNNYYPEYATYYIIPFIGLILIPLLIALHFVLEKVVLKGGK